MNGMNQMMELNYLNLKQKLEINVDSLIFKLADTTKFILNEENDPEKSYEISCTQKKNGSIFLIHPEKMKKMTAYIKENPPKDCDYIIVDCNSKKVFFLELKRSSDTCSARETALQLNSGLQWLLHLFFILDIEFNKEDYEQYLINIRALARQDRKSSMRPDRHGVYNMNGKNIDLREIYKLPGKKS